MLRKITILLSLILTLGFAVTTSAAAQDTPSVDSLNVDGLESGYGRAYMPDLNALVEAMSTPGAATPDLNADGPSAIQISILTFDKADNAKKASDSIADEIASQEVEDVEMKSEEVKDLGDSATLYTGEVKSMGETMAITALLVQDGEQLLQIQIVGGENDANSSQAQAIAQHMLDTEPSTNEVTFNEDGTSTGGAFDRMPQSGDTDLIGDLTPFMDMDLSTTLESGS
ncbi:MAG TPA: hypothetical protein VNZ58_03775 [Thermomicrobiales bacterium]|nr:hypothetical protein [Thermomicrobiales bacterium]